MVTGGGAANVGEGAKKTNCSYLLLTYRGFSESSRSSTPTMSVAQIRLTFLYSKRGAFQGVSGALHGVSGAFPGPHGVPGVCFQGSGAF